MHLFKSFFPKKNRRQLQQQNSADLTVTQNPIPLNFQQIPLDIWFCIFFLLDVKSFQNLSLVNQFFNALTKHEKFNIFFRNALEQSQLFPKELIEKWLPNTNNNNNNNNKAVNARQIYYRTRAITYYQKYCEHFTSRTFIQSLELFFSMLNKSKDKGPVIFLEKSAQLKYPLALATLAFEHSKSEEKLKQWREAFENCQLIPYCNDAKMAGTIAESLIIHARKCMDSEENTNIKKTKENLLYAIAIYELILDFSDLISNEDSENCIKDLNDIKRSMTSSISSYVTKVHDFFTPKPQTDSMIYTSIINECDRVLDVYATKLKSKLNVGRRG